MDKIKELLEQGRVIVAKAGDKATPVELSEAVLEYCEAAGYTLGEVQDLDNGIGRGIRAMFDRCRCMKFSVDQADE